MKEFHIGDLVARKSYGGDIHFTVANIEGNTRSKPIYVLKGLYYRIEADAYSEDLIKPDPDAVQRERQSYLSMVKNQAHGRLFMRNLAFLNRLRSRPGKILHVDSSEDFLDMCIDHYREAKLQATGFLASESRQPQLVKRLLEQHKPDILVLTGHDGFRKGDERADSADRYRNSKYFIESVTVARKYQPSKDKLTIFAGACQSYYEGIMGVGANFASSPGRILINALDPAIVCEKIALTDSKTVVSPKEAVRFTVCGAKGIGGINTRGQLKWV